MQTKIRQEKCRNITSEKENSFLGNLALGKEESDEKDTQGPN